MQFAIMSDVHGNMHALKAVMIDVEKYNISGVVLLGDLIDYGMQSNEVVRFFRDKIKIPIICNIWGNHEQAVMDCDYLKFSSERGKQSAKHTASVIEEDVKAYINNCMEKSGKELFTLCNKKCFAVHGSLRDCYWKSIFPNETNGNYSDFDIVFSGHSHYSHFFSVFYDSDDIKRRNKKATFFLNPGSVGQPRNHNSNAQYAIWEPESMNVYMRSVSYDIEGAMSLFDGTVDDFYRDRLQLGV